LDDFEADKASILGGLLGLLSRALEMLPELSLREYTRMATYMRMGAAIERAQQDDWTEEGSVFLRRYKTNLEEGQAKALQAALSGPALLEWLAGRDWEVEPTWIGTYDKVIEGINSVADAALQKKPA
jgi:hypothetical protein